jgi:predicted transcriptional regulator
MTPDFRLQRRILETLCTLSGLALSENILCDEITMRLPGRTDAGEIRDQIALLKQQGFVESIRGPLGETRWRRTPAGEAALKDLQG